MISEYFKLVFPSIFLYRKKSSYEKDDNRCDFMTEHSLSVWKVNANDKRRKHDFKWHEFIIHFQFTIFKCTHTDTHTHTQNKSKNNIETFCYNACTRCIWILIDPSNRWNYISSRIINGGLYYWLSCLSLTWYAWRPLWYD